MEVGGHPIERAGQKTREWQQQLNEASDQKKYPNKMFLKFDFLSGKLFSDQSTYWLMIYGIAP